MNILRVLGATRVLGKSQGYLGLPVRDEVINYKASGHSVPTMTTAWEPTPDELAALNAGAPIHVRLFGDQHPPIMLSVGGVPE